MLGNLRRLCLAFAALGLLGIGAFSPSVGEDAAPPVRLFVEAEDFQPVEGDWTVRDYGTNYYCGTFAITFLSRGRYLSAPEQGVASKAVR